MSSGAVTPFCVLYLARARYASMSVLRLDLLGPPQAWCDDKPLSFRTRKTVALFAYLAMEVGPHPRERLAGLLWPEASAADGRHSLRTTLDLLRATLNGAAEAALLRRRESIGLDPSALHVFDVRALAEARQLTRASPATPRLRARLERAVDLYRGPFLDTLDLPDAPDYEAWVARQRAQWHGVLGEVCDRLSALQAEAGDAAGAVGTLDRWTHLDPGEEESWRRLIAMCLERGDGAGAQRAWTACRAALIDLGVEPDAATVAVAARLDTLPAGRHSLEAFSLPADPEHIGWGDVPLVGRDADLARLRQCYGDARAGRTCLVVVAGEAGIGKTRLTTEFLRWAREHDADVLLGRAFETRSALPYAPLVDALRGRLERENAPDDLLGDVWLAELARVLPELRERYPDLPAGTEGETAGKASLFEAVARLGAALAERAPLILCLDDVQWADMATLDLMHYVLRRWAEQQARLLVVLVVRAEDAAIDRPLAQWLGSLERAAPSTQVRLSPLAAHAVADLVAVLAGVRGSEEGDVGDRPIAVFGRWLAAKTGGQPFYVVQTLRALVEEDLLRVRPVENAGWVLDVTDALAPERTARLDALLPGGVRALITARLDRLDETAERLLRAGAVLPDVATGERMARVAGLEELVALSAIDHLVGTRLLRETPGGYLVGHDLVRTVVYQSLGEARRRHLHRRALAVLEEEGASAAALAYHAGAAGLVGPAIRHSMAAGDVALTLFAVNNAIGHFEEARRVLVTPAPDGSVGTDPARVAPAERQRLYLQLARAYEWTAAWDEARTAYEALRAEARVAGARAMEGEALTRLALITWQQSIDMEAVQVLARAAIAALEEAGDTAVLAATHITLGMVMSQAGELEFAGQHARHAQALARAAGHPGLAVDGLHLSVRCLIMSGAWDQGIAEAREAIAIYGALAEAAPNVPAASLPVTSATIWSEPQLATAFSYRGNQMNCLACLAMGEIGRGEPRDAVAHGRDGVLFAREPNRVGILAFSAPHLAHGLVEVGSYEEALVHAEQGVMAARGIATSSVVSLGPLIMALQAHARVQQVLGEGTAAQASVMEAGALAARMGVGYWSLIPANYLCANRALAGDWPGAFEAACRSVTLRDSLQARLVPFDTARHYETEALLRGDGIERARADLRRFGERLGPDRQDRRYRLVYQRMQALLDRWDHRLDDAVSALERALGLACEIDLPGEQRQIHLALADLYGARGSAGDGGHAALARERAETVTQILAARIADAGLRRSFLKNVP